MKNQPSSSSPLHLVKMEMYRLNADGTQTPIASLPALPKITRSPFTHAIAMLRAELARCEMELAAHTDDEHFSFGAADVTDAISVLQKEMQKRAGRYPFTHDATD